MMIETLISTCDIIAPEEVENTKKREALRFLSYLEDNAKRRKKFRPEQASRMDEELDFIAEARQKISEDLAKQPDTTFSTGPMKALRDQFPNMKAKMEKYEKQGGPLPTPYDDDDDDDDGAAADECAPAKNALASNESKETFDLSKKKFCPSTIMYFGNPTDVINRLHN